MTPSAVQPGNGVAGEAVGPLNLGTRTFTEADQAAFARWSGDHNPIHMDAAAARRTLAGASVVHGIHALLWALDCLARSQAIEGERLSLRADFRKFIHLGRPIAAVASRGDKSGWRVELRSGDDVMTVAQLVPTAAARPSDLELQDFPILQHSTVPLEPDPAQLGSLAGRLAPGPDQNLLASLPHLRVRLGDGAVAAVGQLSRLVGMINPGLHSVFAAVDLTIVSCGPSGSGLAFRTSRYDDRFRVVRIDVDGSGVSGSIRAIVRPEPVDAPAMASLVKLVGQTEFASRRALIVGGSRGLGAAVAKLLAAGGAEVVITYARGEGDARAVCEDIVSVRPEANCAMMTLDLSGPTDQLLDRADLRPTHIYYFATPHIQRQSGLDFDPAAFRLFCDFYVHACHALVTRYCARGEPLMLFYPSTIFIEQRPRGMTEYAMAKAAGEQLCADLPASHPQLSVQVERLPRIRTDQTAGLSDEGLADPVDLLLPLLRAQQAALSCPS